MRPLKTKFKRLIGIFLLTLSIALVTNLTYAADPVPGNLFDTPLAQTLAKPGDAAQVTSSDTTKDGLKRDWQSDRLLTAGLQFLVRGKEALAWSLNLEPLAWDKTSIQETYQKVLTIVNSLLILGLLAIAGLWLFNWFIPRTYLRRVMMVYVLAVVFVNFALPLNQLLIDGTNLIQKAFMVREGNRVEIADVVQVPHYSDATAYTRSGNAEGSTTEQRVTIQMQGAPGQDSVSVGQLRPLGDVTESQVSGALGNLTIVTSKNQAAREIALANGQPITATIRNQTGPLEFSLFTFALVGLTGLAYLILALIFALRVVILWALLVLSPLLFFLAIFQATRGYFYNWLSWYGRWLLIGPLTALGISLVVGLWKATGIPLQSSYVSADQFGLLSNLAFYLPGRTAPNTLSTTSQMMEYIVFLSMLYIPIFFAFVLTRQKQLAGVATLVQENTIDRFRKQSMKTTVTESKTVEEKSTAGNTGNAQGGVINQFRNFFDRQVSKMTETVIPGRQPNAAPGDHVTIETASSLLPQQIVLMGTHQLLDIVHDTKESRHGHEEAISRLAFTDKITNVQERRTVETVKTEIEKRAARGETESILIQNEMTERQAQPTPAVHSSERISVTNNYEKIIETKTEKNEPNKTVVDQPMTKTVSARPILEIQNQKIEKEKTHEKKENDKNQKPKKLDDDLDLG